MHYTYHNVNDAFANIVESIIDGRIATKRQQTRNGPVLRIPGPVTITYRHPTERVLFNEVRDCNPFFHLYEALWMLAGRDDVESLSYYSSKIGDFSDNGTTFHGAYGYRWRKYFGFDQIEQAYKQLYHHPNDRRVVLQMWDGENDLIVAGNGGKDVPCNLSAVFEIDNRKLNMTVFNRSNDLVWGMFGANAVHFSILQEYLAAKLGVKVGRYHQITSNLHIYLDIWKGTKYLEPGVSGLDDARYTTNSVLLVEDPLQFDKELPSFVDNVETLCKEPFLANVAAPMCLAFRHHKERDYGKAYEAMEQVKSDDWRKAGTLWIASRDLRYRIKSQTTKA